MSTNNPQILYMILVLPALFGLVLAGEGLNKIVHKKDHGVILMIIGLMIVVAAALLLFSSPVMG